MKILQIGEEDFSYQQTLPDYVSWYYTSVENLSTLLSELREEAYQKLPPEQALELGDSSKVRLTFSAVLLTSPVQEEALEEVAAICEAHALFQIDSFPLLTGEERGLFRRKVLRQLPYFPSCQSLIDYLVLNVFDGQYGAKLKIPEIDVSPNFKGHVAYKGHVGVTFSGDFGEIFRPLFSFRYNLSSFPMALELWPEYSKKGDCYLQFEITALRKGSTGDIVERYIATEVDLRQPYLIPHNPEIGFYAVSVLAKGRGELTMGAVHWRYSRMGLGQFVLGGERSSDSRRQELFTYFNPGDMKPPLNVYFSGFRGAEGFEGFWMMKSMKAPFLLVADPRLEGGCFYLGTEDLELAVRKKIRQALNYLGFESSQLILSGLSMGAFGAVYHSTGLTPHAVIVGKPFTNLGDTVARLKLKRPHEFETSADMLYNVIGHIDEEGMKAFNQRFWDYFQESNFEATRYVFAYMEQDDYDGLAAERLIPYLMDRGSHLYFKGYEGRHNDNSPAINKWFKTQYTKILRENFGRK